MGAHVDPTLSPVTQKSPFLLARPTTPCPFPQILKEKTPFDEKPLYLYLSHQAVHKPLGLPPEGVFSEDELKMLKEIEANSGEKGHLRKRFAKVC